MKISKLLLQTIAISLTAATLTSCQKEKPELKKPLTEKTKEGKTSYDCPGCGMG